MLRFLAEIIGAFFLVWIAAEGVKQWLRRWKDGPQFPGERSETERTETDGKEQPLV